MNKNPNAVKKEKNDDVTEFLVERDAPEMLDMTELGLDTSELGLNLSDFD